MLADVFQESGEEALDMLRAHISRSTPDNDWKTAAHKLKGSSAQIGANSLSDACRKAQEGFSRLSKNEKQALLAEIERCFQEVCGFFEKRQNFNLLRPF